MVNKKEFNASKKPIALNFVGIDKIPVAFEHKGKGFKYYIGYTGDSMLDLYALFYLKWKNT